MSWLDCPRSGDASDPRTRISSTQQKATSMRTRRILPLAVTMLLLLAACGDDGDSSSSSGSSGGGGGDDATELPVARLQGLSGGTGAVALKVMEMRGLDEKHGFEGDFQYVAADAALQNFLNGESDVSFDAGPLDLAIAANSGEDVVAMGPAITNAVRIIVREDSDIETIDDLVGKKLGQYGDDSTGSLYVAYLLDRFHDIDYYEDFELVTQAPPALLPLLETGQVDAVLNFQPHLANAATTIGTRVIYDPDLEWREETGGRLWSTLQASRVSWIEANRELAASINAAWCEAAEWMNANIDELVSEPEYVELFGLEGEALETLAEQMKADDPFFGCEWDDELQAGMESIVAGVAEQGTLFTEAPAGLFLPLDEIAG